MKIIHKIGLRLTEAQRLELQSLGVMTPPGHALPGGGPPLVVFAIEETDPMWATVRRLVQKWGGFDFVSTRFAPGEISAAKWLEVAPGWHHGYPQPDAPNSGYLQATYDLADHCDTCGVGKRQKAPFQLVGEPRWGRRGILQLNWVFDEYFVKPEIWAGVFKPHGITCRAVTNKRNVELQTVVQLVVEEVAHVAVRGLTCATCPACNRAKYEHNTRGFFPALLSKPTRPMVKTVEWFGSGAAADKCVLVSQALARTMTAFELRGSSFQPVANDDDELD